MATDLTSPIAELRSHQWPLILEVLVTPRGPIRICDTVDRQWTEDVIQRKKPRKQMDQDLGTQWPKGMNLQSCSLTILLNHALSQ